MKTILQKKKTQKESFQAFMREPFLSFPQPLTELGKYNVVLHHWDSSSYSS